MRRMDREVTKLAQLSSMLLEEYVDETESEWDGSPFAWIRSRASRQKGAIGEKLVSGWVALHGFDVARSPDVYADRVIGSRRVEIKVSMLWKTGGYTFQQFRNQNYEFAFCLGISPFDAHAWIIPKAVVLQHAVPQHGGAGGSDTRWISFQTGEPPVWMAPYGGKLREALAVARSVFA